MCTQMKRAVIQHTLFGLLVHLHKDLRTPYVESDGFGSRKQMLHISAKEKSAYPTRTKPRDRQDNLLLGRATFE